MEASLSYSSRYVELHIEAFHSLLKTRLLKKLRNFKLMASGTVVHHLYTVGFEPTYPTLPTYPTDILMNFSQVSILLSCPLIQLQPLQFSNPSI